MKSYTKMDLQGYRKNDWIKRLLAEASCKEDARFRTNVWLREMESKRMVYADMYGDLLLEKTDKSVLDVGGGVTSLTRRLAANTEYTLLDYMAHGEQEAVRQMAESSGMLWKCEDWYEFTPEGRYDIVIANDIFPDVDQRLELFIQKFLPVCEELRLLVTYYNRPRFYLTQRTDDTEKLTFLSWDGEITAMKLKKYLRNIVDSSLEQLEEMKSNFESIYRNGRQICFLTLKSK